MEKKSPPRALRESNGSCSLSDAGGGGGSLEFSPKQTPGVFCLSPHRTDKKQVKASGWKIFLDKVRAPHAPRKAAGGERNSAGKKSAAKRRLRLRARRERESEWVRERKRQRRVLLRHNKDITYKREPPEPDIFFNGGLKQEVPSFLRCSARRISFQFVVGSNKKCVVSTKSVTFSTPKTPFSQTHASLFINLRSKIMTRHFLRSPSRQHAVSYVAENKIYQKIRVPHTLWQLCMCVLV